MNNVEVVEEKVKHKAAEREMCRWIILALVRGDNDAKQVVPDIAREELEMVEATMMAF